MIDGPFCAAISDGDIPYVVGDPKGLRGKEWAETHALQCHILVIILFNLVLTLFDVPIHSLFGVSIKHRVLIIGLLLYP
jgi:hypothetical protein